MAVLRISKKVVEEEASRLKRLKHRQLDWP